MLWRQHIRKIQSRERYQRHCFVLYMKTFFYVLARQGRTWIKENLRGGGSFFCIRRKFRVAKYFFFPGIGSV